MLLKTEDNSKTELSFRPVVNPKEFLHEKTDKKDIIITILLYLIMAVIIIWNIF